MAKIQGGVGKSNRTPGKHDALNKILGKVVGVHSVQFPNKKLVVVDCTAGDGIPNEFSKLTSPGIIDKHLRFLESNDIKTDAVFYEKSSGSAQSLKEAFPNRMVINGDSKQMLPIWDESSVLFVNNDPNTIADWALPLALDMAPPLTVVFSTMGCNVGGIKRLPLEQRVTWYEFLESQTALVIDRGWQDAYLVTLAGDSSQWAYLVNAPTKWIPDIENAFQKAFAYSGYQAVGYWCKKDKKQFSSLVDQLFRTREENKS